MNWLVDNSPIREVIWEELGREATLADEFKNEVGDEEEPGISDTPEPVAPGPDRTSEVSALRYCIGHYDLKDYPNISDLQWSELFAALALACIDLALEDEKRYGRKIAHDKDGVLSELRVATNVPMWIVYAMDAISTAEGLHRESQSVIKVKAIHREEAKKQASLRSQAANVKRNAQNNAALLELREMYLNGKFPSIRNAAQIYCERNPEKVAHLSPYNRVRTMAEGLSKLLKNKRLSLK